MKLIQDRKGQSAIEYILIVAALVGLIIALLNIVQPGVNKKITDIQNGLK